MRFSGLCWSILSSSSMPSKDTARSFSLSSSPSYSFPAHLLATMSSICLRIQYTSELNFMILSFSSLVVILLSIVCIYNLLRKIKVLTWSEFIGLILGYWICVGFWPNQMLLTRISSREFLERAHFAATFWIASRASFFFYLRFRFFRWDLVSPTFSGFGFGGSCAFETTGGLAFAASLLFLFLR